MCELGQVLQSWKVENVAYEIDLLCRIQRRTSLKLCVISFIWLVTHLDKLFPLLPQLPFTYSAAAS